MIVALSLEKILNLLVTSFIGENSKMPGEEKRIEITSESVLPNLNGDPYGTSWFLRFHDRDLLSSADGGSPVQARKESVVIPAGRSR